MTLAPLSLLASIAELSLAAFVITMPTATRWAGKTKRLFALCLASFAVWAVVSFLILNAPNALLASEWTYWGVVTLTAGLVLFYLTALSLSRANRYPAWTAILLAIPALLPLAARVWRVESAPWGWRRVWEPWFLLVWILIGTTFLAISLRHHLRAPAWRKTTSYRTRVGLFVLGWAIATAVTIGSAIGEAYFGIEPFGPIGAAMTIVIFGAISLL